MQTFFSPDFKKILLSFWSVHYQEGPVSNFCKLNKHISMQKKKESQNIARACASLPTDFLRQSV